MNDLDSAAHRAGAPIRGYGLVLGLLLASPLVATSLAREHRDVCRWDLPQGHAGVPVDDSRNEFLRAERRYVERSHTLLDGGAEVWLSTAWTYAPDAMDANLHHVKLLFGLYRKGAAEHGFLLAVCSMREADGLASIEQLDWLGAEPKGGRIDARQLSLCAVPGGLVASYVCKLDRAVIEKAASEGLALRQHHESGLDYDLMYPAEFFRGMLAGVRPGGSPASDGLRVLDHYLVGGARAATANTQRGVGRVDRQVTMDFVAGLRRVFDPPAQLADRSRARSRSGAIERLAGAVESVPPAGYPRRELWKSAADRIVAAFPGSPKRVEAGQPGVRVHAYQDYFEFEDDLMAMAQVTITSGSAAAEVAGRNMLRMTHASYASSIGAEARRSRTKEIAFGVGKAALEFEVYFRIDGVPAVSTGFWVLDGDRVVRVSVVYPEALPPQDIAVARHFPKTFGLIGAVAGSADNEDVPARGGLPPSPLCVELPLSKGVTVELPKNWTALTSNQLVTLGAAVEARQDLAGITRPDSNLPFAANLYGDNRQTLAMFNVRYYPALELTQEFVRQLSPAEIAEFDAEFRRMTEDQAVSGVRLLEWSGTTRRTINGTTALVVDYRRAGLREETAFGCGSFAS